MHSRRGRSCLFPGVNKETSRGYPPTPWLSCQSVSPTDGSSDSSVRHDSPALLRRQRHAKAVGRTYVFRKSLRQAATHPERNACSVQYSSEIPSKCVKAGWKVFMPHSSSVGHLMHLSPPTLRRRSPSNPGLPTPTRNSPSQCIRYCRF
jgi:hypothetical protein